MLSQRSVAKFELFYAAMLQPAFYGESSLIQVGVYATELYAEGLPNELLHKLHRKTDFNPSFARALYEGIAVADTLQHHSVMETDRQLGAAYLLVCMAVAIRFYRSANYDAQEPVRLYHDALVSSLAEDGYTYSGGKMYNTATADVVRSVALNGEPPRSVVPAKPVEQVVPALLETSSVEVVRPMKKHQWLIKGAATTIGASGFFWLLSIFNSEFHDWLLPKLQSVWHFLIRVVK